MAEYRVGVSWLSIVVENRGYKPWRMGGIGMV